MRRIIKYILRTVVDAYRYLTFPVCSYRGIYDSFDSAIADAPAKGIGYNHANVARWYKDNLNRGLDNSEYAVLYHLEHSTRNGGTVVDLGGNVGVHFLRYKRHLSNVNVKWIVADLPEINKVGREVCAAHGDVEFVDNVEELARTIDVLLLIGFDQYVDAARTIIGKLRPMHIIIDELPVHDGSRFVTLQNGGSVYYPLYVFNRQEYISMVSDQGYRLVDNWSVCLESCLIPFHLDHSIPAFSGFYFSRNDGSRTPSGAHLA